MAAVQECFQIQEGLEGIAGVGVQGVLVDGVADGLAGSEGYAVGAAGGRNDHGGGAFGEMAQGDEFV